MAECPWNGCNRIRGIKFPKISKIGIGFYTGDAAANRKIFVGFRPEYFISRRVILGSAMGGFDKTLNMTVWESMNSTSGVRNVNSIKFIDDGIEINDNGLFFEVNRQDYGYDWIAFTS